MDPVIIRTTMALAAVLLFMWVCAKVLRKGTQGRSSDVVELIGRQSLSKTASVAVVRIADRAFILGITETQVELVAETTLESVRPTVPAAREQRIPLAEVPVAAPLVAAPLVLAPATAPVPAAVSSAAAPLDLSTVRDIVPQPRSGGVLAGSALSVATWRTGINELRERSVRRP